MIPSCQQLRVLRLMLETLATFGYFWEFTVSLGWSNANYLEQGHSWQSLNPKRHVALHEFISTQACMVCRLLQSAPTLLGSCCLLGSRSFSLPLRTSRLCGAGRSSTPNCIHWVCGGGCKGAFVWHIWLQRNFIQSHRKPKQVWILNSPISVAELTTINWKVSDDETMELVDGLPLRVFPAAAWVSNRITESMASSIVRG